ncbi:MAG: FAD-binding oxidoreductase [Holophagales bacterium]|nr:FAD-binding oxidoreductase [Holophagales bacterium]
MALVQRPDLLLIGGGIAGLVCLDRLVSAGFDVLLVDRSALGTGQTAHTQGILHSGLKYLLHGRAPDDFRGLVARWRASLDQGHEMDLRGCRLLSESVLVWSSSPFSADLLERFAEDGRPCRVESPPSLLGGEVFHFPEPVIDVFSLLARLRDRHRERLLLGDADIVANGDSVRVSVAEQLIEPRRLLLTAGAGNAELLRRLDRPIAMRRLPLQMVVARSADLPPLWGHGVVGDGPPALTVTHHGDGVWYLGGRLSEEGVERSREEQIGAAKASLSRLLPALDLRGVSFDTLRIERAEPVRPAAERFEIRVEGESPVWVAWPIKLVLAPRLADQVLERLRREGVEPSTERAELPNLPTPGVAKAPWLS